jgi:hypothetical protein
MYVLQCGPEAAPEDVGLQAAGYVNRYIRLVVRGSVSKNSAIT